MFRHMVGLRPWTIFLGGLVLAGIFQMFVTRAFGDSAAMLQVGESSSVAPFIKSELGDDIPIFPDFGHDGQAAYVIARQPFGGEAGEALGAPAFRYRRWLYPALGGVMGTLSPRATIVGLAIWSAIGFGLAAAALVVIGETYGVRSRLLALAVYLNVGLILSTVISTPDSLGLGLSLAGVAAYRKGHRALAVLLLAAAVLTKEQFLIFAIAVAIDAWIGGQRRAALIYLLVPFGVLVVVSLIVVSAFGGSGGLGSNVTAPFFGIVEASHGWSSAYVVSRRASYLSLFGLAAIGPVALWSRQRLIILMSAGWFAGAVLGGEVVWRKGTDSLRVYAAIWSLMALAAAVAVREQRRRPTGEN